MPQEVDLSCCQFGRTVDRVQATGHLVALDDSLDELGTQVLDLLDQITDTIGNEVPGSDLTHRPCEQLGSLVAKRHGPVQLTQITLQCVDLGVACVECAFERDSGGRTLGGQRFHRRLGLGYFLFQVLCRPHTDRLECTFDLGTGLRSCRRRFVYLLLGLAKFVFPEAHVVGSIGHLLGFVGQFLECVLLCKFLLRSNQNLSLTCKFLRRFFGLNDGKRFTLPCFLVGCGLGLSSRILLVRPLGITQRQDFGL